MANEMRADLCSSEAEVRLWGVPNRFPILNRLSEILGSTFEEKSETCWNAEFYGGWSVELRLTRQGESTSSYELVVSMDSSHPLHVDSARMMGATSPADVCRLLLEVLGECDSIQGSLQN